MILHFTALSTETPFGITQQQKNKTYTVIADMKVIMKYF